MVPDYEVYENEISLKLPLCVHNLRGRNSVKPNYITSMNSEYTVEKKCILTL